MWIPIEQDVIRHPKTIKLSRILNLSLQETVGYLLFFWSWAADFAKDGSLKKFDTIDIACGCMLDRKISPETFQQALVDCRFLVETEEGLSINGWHEYTGKHIQKMEKNAEKMRRYRNKEDTLPLCNGNVTVTEPSRNGNVTGKDNIIKEKIKEENIEENTPGSQGGVFSENSDIEEENIKIPYESFSTLWNKIIGSPKVSRLTPSRKVTIRSRWNESPEYQNKEFWINFFKKVNASDFLSGRDGKWQGCCFDWVLKPANFVKIVEGNYDNKAPVSGAVKAAPSLPEWRQAEEDRVNRHYEHLRKLSQKGGS